jgi:hypothetical protein
MKTVAGATNTLLGSLLLRLTVTPPANAGVLKVTGKTTG